MDWSAASCRRQQQQRIVPATSAVAAQDSPGIPVCFVTNLEPPNPETAYVAEAAWDIRSAEPVAVASMPDIAMPVVGRRSCKALAAVVAACLGVAWTEALAEVRIAALRVSRRRTLHRRH